MRFQAENLDRGCLMYVPDIDIPAVGDLVGVIPLDLGTYQSYSDGIGLSDWTEDPRLATVKRWGRGVLISEMNGGSEGAKAVSLAAVAAAGHTAAVVCWNGRGIHGWSGWANLVAYVKGGRLAVAFDPVLDPSNRLGSAPKSLDKLQRGLSWDDVRESSTVLLERLSGKELDDELVWGEGTPESYHLIKGPAVRLTEEEISHFLGIHSE